MRYTHFERLVLTVGAAAVLGSLAASIPAGGKPELVEIVAQLGLFAVLFAAVRLGRRGGLIAAVLAAGAYVLLRVPTLPGDLTVEVALVIASRMAAFGLLGVVGGEIATRLRYSLSRLEDGSAIDEWSHVFNERYIAQALQRALGRSTRYGEPFSVVLLGLSPSLFAGLTAARQRSLVRSLAERVRSDLRMVDEVGRLEDGRFVVLLPHTPKAGGNVVAERICALARDTLGARDESVTCVCMGAPEDQEPLSRLDTELNKLHADDQAESVS